MFKFDYNKAYKKEYARQLKRHNEYESSDKRYCKKEGIEYKPKEFKFNWSIDWKPRLKIFKYKARSENTFDPYAMEAHSYGHWCYFKRIKGVNVFNNYSYSNTTSGHQGAMRSLLKQLGIKIDLEVSTRSSLTASLVNTIEPLYSKIAENEVCINRKNSKPSSNKFRRSIIRECWKKVRVLEKLGATSSLTYEKILEDQKQYEMRRLERLAEEAKQRKALKDRMKAIRKADPKTLDVKEITTETNAEIRKELVNRIGIVRVIQELGGEVIDKKDNYELINLRIRADEPTWRKRPYLKMINPSTGEIHVEGVAPRCSTVLEALAWRNELHVDDYNEPEKIS